MLVVPDLSEVQDEVTPGKYSGRIKRAEVKEWPNGGVYVHWQIETFGENEQKNNGRIIHYKTACGGKGAFTLQRLYKAATGQPLQGAFDSELLIGREIKVEVVDGKDRNTGELTGYTEVKNVTALS